jgi:5,10-methylenetetrahydromethanopterin reductase
MPAVYRNPLATAMEIATLANLHPGRFVAGLGHGVPAWMEQIGALPVKPVRALEETVIAVRRLLRGETVTSRGDYVNLRDVRLEQAPATVPPVVLGVRRPFGLRAAGRSADGVILAEPSPPAYIRQAIEQLDKVRRAADDGDGDHRITVFVKGRIEEDRDHARQWVARILLEESVAAQLASLEPETDLASLRALGDPIAIASHLPDRLLDRLTATGTTEQVTESLDAIAETGVDSIAFVPIGPDPDEQLDLLATGVAPMFRAR